MERREEIRARTDLVELIESDGVRLHGSSHTLSGVCPFHDDRNPSLRVYRERGWWWCYGCATGGDVFEWVMRRDSCDFRHALQTLEGATTTSAPIRTYARIVPRRQVRIPNLVVDAYHQELLQRPEIIEWLGEHRHWSMETICCHRIGYSADDRKVMVPIPSPSIDGWGDIRRYDVLHRGAQKIQKMMPYESGLPCLPFFLRNYRTDYLLIVEGEPDALAAASAGLNVATNTCGSGAAYKVWRDWYGLVTEPTIVLCFDRDEAGHQAVYGTDKRPGLVGLFPDARVIDLPEELGPKSDITDAIDRYGGEYVKDMIEGVL